MTPHSHTVPRKHLSTWTRDVGEEVDGVVGDEEEEVEVGEAVVHGVVGDEEDVVVETDVRDEEAVGDVSFHL